MACRYFGKPFRFNPPKFTGPWEPLRWTRYVNQVERDFKQALTRYMEGSLKEARQLGIPLPRTPMSETDGQWDY